MFLWQRCVWFSDLSAGLSADVRAESLTVWTWWERDVSVWANSKTETLCRLGGICGCFNLLAQQFFLSLSLQGVFPASYIHLKKAIVTNRGWVQQTLHPSAQTVTPLTLRLYLSVLPVCHSGVSSSLVLNQDDKYDKNESVRAETNSFEFKINMSVSDISLIHVFWLWLNPENFWTEPLTALLGVTEEGVTGVNLVV